MFFVARPRKTRLGDEILAGAAGLPALRCDNSGVTKGRSMSTFDDPFDADRELSRAGCVCGQHRSAAEHEQAALTLRCEPVANQETKSDDKRYEGVVASAVIRAVFPRDAARRAFLKSVGASTALAALSQFFPLKTATEV